VQRIPAPALLSMRSVFDLTRLQDCKTTVTENRYVPPQPSAGIGGATLRPGVANLSHLARLDSWEWRHLDWDGPAEYR
jgi:hypothetical protein